MKRIDECMDMTVLVALLVGPTAFSPISAKTPG